MSTLELVIIIFMAVVLVASGVMVGVTTRELSRSSEPEAPDGEQAEPTPETAAEEEQEPAPEETYDEQYAEQPVPPYDPQYAEQPVPPYDPQYGYPPAQPYDEQYAQQPVPPYGQYQSYGQPMYPPVGVVGAAGEGEAPKGTVSFAADTALTHEDKYLALSEEERGWYEDIVAYAAAVEGAKNYIGKRYEEYAIGSRKIVRLSIKRGVIVCDFIIRNNNFFEFASENKISVSSKPTSVKVNSADRVTAAKGIIDIVVKNIEEEKECKRRLVNERRRQRYAEKASQNEKNAEKENSDGSVSKGDVE